jgi:hypothetical protein
LEEFLFLPVILKHHLNIITFCYRVIISLTEGDVLAARLKKFIVRVHFAASRSTYPLSAPLVVFIEPWRFLVESFDLARKSHEVQSFRAGRSEMAQLFCLIQCVP